MNHKFMYILCILVRQKNMHFSRIMVQKVMGVWRGVCVPSLGVSPEKVTVFERILSAFVLDFFQLFMFSKIFFQHDFHESSKFTREIQIFYVDFVKIVNRNCGNLRSNLLKMCTLCSPVPLFTSSWYRWKIQYFLLFYRIFYCFCDL